MIVARSTFLPLMPQQNTPHALPPWLFFALPSIYFILHTLEELPYFASWVTVHFGPMSALYFASIHIPLILLSFYASHRAYKDERSTGWVIFCTAGMMQFVFNALFHLTTAALFMEYSPGMVTAACLSLFFAVYFVKRILNEERLNKKQVGWAAWWGFVMAAAAVGTLFLH
jgi:hypothetical protein